MRGIWRPRVRKQVSSYSGAERRGYNPAEVLWQSVFLGLVPFGLFVRTLVRPLSHIVKGQSGELLLGKQRTCRGSCSKDRLRVLGQFIILSECPCQHEHGDT